MRRLERSRIPLIGWALIGLAAFVLLLAVVFIGPRPVQSAPFELKAAFRSESELQLDSPVRIAGVDVGQVTGIEPLGDDTGAAVVTMRIDDDGLPIRADATVTIRTRLLLEGNFYVELQPGSPSARELDSGETLAVDRTAGPVQLDRVLSDLTVDTRTSLRTVLQGLGQSVGDAPGGGEPAGDSLNRALGEAPEAFRAVIKTNEGLRGENPDDLSEFVSNTQRVLATLAGQQADLSDLIGNFDVTMAAFASRAAEIRESLRLLPPVLSDARTAFVALNRALPQTRAFALELTPSIEHLPATIELALPWIDQATLLLSPEELGGLATDLAPAIRDTASAIDATEGTVEGLDLLDRCLLGNLLPTGDAKISDPPLTADATVSQEFFQTLVGVVGATQNFDGNGRYARAQTAGGAYPVESGPFPSSGVMRGNAVLPPLGTRPDYPGAQPPLRFDVPCGEAEPPDLDATTGAGP